jgi:hypothetical protein
MTMDWQPIETAPEKGAFLVWGGTEGGELGGEAAVREAMKVEAAIKGRARFDVANTCYYAVWVDNPTHWMPLPDPPSD